MYHTAQAAAKGVALANTGCAGAGQKGPVESKQVQATDACRVLSGALHVEGYVDNLRCLLTSGRSGPIRSTYEAFIHGGHGGNQD